MFFGVPMPSLQQSLPILGGIDAGQRMYRQHLQNRAQRYNNQMLPPMSQALLAQRQAQAQQSQFNAEHAPDLLDLRRQLLEQGDRRIALGQDHNQIQRQKLPGQNLRAATGAMNTAAGLTAAGADNVLTGNYLDLANQVSGSGQGGIYDPGRYGAPQPQGQMPQQASMPEALIGDQEAPQQMPAQSPMISPESTPVRDDVIEAAQQAARDQVAKKTSTAAILNQRHYYENVLTTLEGVKDDVVTAANAYSGLQGTARLAKDMANAAAGKGTSPELKAYNNLKSVVSTLLSGETTRALGEAHSENVNHAMNVLAQPVTWNKSPELALSQVNSLYNNIRNLAKQSSHSTSQTQENLAAIDPNAAPLISDALMGQSSGGQTKEGYTKIIGPSGATHWIPNDKVSSALAAGGKRAE